MREGSKSLSQFQLSETKIWDAGGCWVRGIARLAGPVVAPAVSSGHRNTSLAFGKQREEDGVRPSMGSVGDAYDNALCDRLFGSIECELIERTSLPSFTHARGEVFEYVEGWYNPHRRHSALGCDFPVIYE